MSILWLAMAKPYIMKKYLIYKTMRSDNFWCVLYTRTNYEKKIKKELDKRQIINYLPIYSDVHQWSDRKKKVDVPLFPNYIFINRNLLNLYDVLSIKGIVKYLKNEHGISRISEDTIDLLKESSKVGVLTYPMTKKEKSIILEFGTNKFSGTLIGHRGENRIAIFLPELNKTIIVNQNSISQMAS
jgi:transcriptional antiterminator RfaH